MRRVPTPLEITGYATLSFLGLYMLYRGMTDQMAAALIGGALCLTLGVTTLVSAIRTFLWHRQMLRGQAPTRKLI
jgi:hypothetical protein